MLNYLSKFQIDILIDNCKTVKRELKQQKGTEDLIEMQNLCIKRLVKMRMELTRTQKDKS